MCHFLSEDEISYLISKVYVHSIAARRCGMELTLTMSPDDLQTTRDTSFYWHQVTETGLATMPVNPQGQKVFLTWYTSQVIKINHKHPKDAKFISRGISSHVKKLSEELRARPDQPPWGRRGAFLAGWMACIGRHVGLLGRLVNAGNGTPDPLESEYSRSLTALGS